MKTIVAGATLVNRGKMYEGATLVVEGDTIVEVRTDNSFPQPAKHHHVVDARGMYLLPGLIDGHVHMRDPGLTHKADMHTETMAAAAGGVTTVFDMPNVIPQTTTLQAWQERMDYAAQHCHVNYAFYLGATHTNLDEILSVDATRLPGIKLFMGSSTGGMLVDGGESLEKIFAQCSTLLMTHCEDTERINERMIQVQHEQGTDDPDVKFYPLVRDEEACLRSTKLAVALAQKYGTRLHIAHVSTRAEVDLLRQIDAPRITAEACVGHLLFNDEMYQTLGTLIKCNPAIKERYHQQAILAALQDHTLACLATDHAPHLLSDKEGGCRRAASGIPMMQFGLPAVLSSCVPHQLSMPEVVNLMCHRPAQIYGVEGRGYLEPGYKADFVLLRQQDQTISNAQVLSRCGWTPFAGTTFHWTVEQTWVNGQRVWDGHQVDCSVKGQAVCFDRD